MEATDQNKNPPASDGPAEIERLKDEARHEHDMYLRALADFENYRRRVERERSRAARSDKREIILSLLDVMDGFERALTHMNDAPRSVAQGLQALHRQLLGVLETQGVTPLKSLGETFNPEVHDAIGSVESEEVESGAVAEELQRGYRWGDDVLRPARVRVAS
ncbi:MAG TPA: nucleotide exchange factor GrpE [Candidatus Saccharimonadales bacterium]|jgi:molecular chaperone GrpE|nr:nucleotide exchange factor GrpE [Candidatus Saccharimonadales bacterium]